MTDPTREDLARFQAALGERDPGTPLWAAVDRAVQAALMSLGAEAAGVAGAITRLATEFENAHTASGHGHGGGEPLRLDALALSRIAEGYIKARNELRSVERTEINLPFLTADQTGPKHFQRVITKRELPELERRTDLATSG